MLPYAFYLLKVMLCSGILFGYYWLLLRNKIYHRYNRFYLLATVVISLAMPLIQIDIWHSADAPAKSIQLLQVVTGSNQYLDEIVLTARQNNFTSEQVAFLLYLLTCFIFLSLFIQVLLKIRTLLKQHQHTIVNNICLVNTTAKGTPFSFLKYIFWNDNIDLSTTIGSQIFKHEVAHVQQKHSYDKLFINALLIFFWSNPFFWLVRKELNMIHEFMADKIAVEDSDTEAFAAMILQATYPQQQFALTNPFFYSPIKRRLLMLTKNKNPKASYIGRVLVLPLAVLLFAAFTLKTKTIAHTPVYQGKKITVVLDAGHGGKDFGAVSLDGKIMEKDLALSIVKKIKELNSNQNINIILTRQNDIYQSPPEKVDFSKAQNPDLFISIHIAAASKESSSIKNGMSVYVFRESDGNTFNSKLFASAIINEFANNYKIPVSNLPLQRETGIWVLKQSTCPAVLIEAGFITNKKDLTYLQTEAAKETIAKNVLAAIERYLTETKKIENANALSLIQPDVIITKKIIDTVPKPLLKNYGKALIILDGKTISKEEYKKINPENIQTVEVLKNENEVAQYGEKAKNGVIKITTKSKILVLDNSKTNVKETSGNGNNDKVEIKSADNLQLKNSLYVVNGKVQTASFKLNSIAANEIESINVLKDKSAVDKYGDKGKNGVIEIYTKKMPSTYLSNNMEDDKIFTQVENEPKFPGGDSAWKRYLVKNLNASTPVDEGWKPGTYKITVSFIVNKDGSIKDIKTDNYPGSKTADQCINLIKKGPRWVPALQNGKNVTAYKKQPITFVIEAQ